MTRTGNRPVSSADDLDDGQSRTAAENNVHAVTEPHLVTHKCVEFIAKCSGVQLHLLRGRGANSIISNLSARKGKPGANKVADRGPGAPVESQR